MSGLVLSLFPGLDFLGMAFEEEGFTVVRGPDVIWGGDITRFHPPAGRFDGVIGGPPCQMFSALAPLVRHNGHEPRFGNLIPEYERCVAEAAPAWFVMEEVRGAALPNVEGYDRWATLLKDSDVGGVQPRVRRISMGFRDGLWDAATSPFTLVEYAETLATERHTLVARSGTFGSGRRAKASVIGADSGIAYEEARRTSVLGDGRSTPVKIGGSGKPKRTVTTNSAGGSFGDTRRDPDSGRPGRTRSVKADDRPTRREARAVLGAGTTSTRDGSRLAIARMLEAQGLPPDYLDDAPFTVQGKRQAIGNGVPLPMGRAIARAVRKAIS